MCAVRVGAQRSGERWFGRVFLMIEAVVCVRCNIAGGVAGWAVVCRKLAQTLAWNMSGIGMTATSGEVLCV